MAAHLVCIEEMGVRFSPGPLYDTSSREIADLARPVRSPMRLRIGRHLWCLTSNGVRRLLTISRFWFDFAHHPEPVEGQILYLHTKIFGVGVYFSRTEFLINGAVFYALIFRLYSDIIRFSRYTCLPAGRFDLDP